MSNTEPLSSVLARTQRAYDASVDRYAKRICSEIDARLVELQKHLPNLMFCDGMGSTSMYDKAKPFHDDPIREAFDHVLFTWSADEKPSLDADDADTELKKAASAIVAQHGEVMFEIATAARFLDNPLNTAYGAFP